ncbi:transcriptional repressor LexA [bacterium]|jgi:repressor LexA|nr:transcriptional repressor LexA [bacterium]MDB2577109.1 transcriptional repressor LexA [Planctomycetota bacterium]MDB4724717.1 transcriptional repressor LexA [Planctomycetota bacterium]
MSTPPLTRRQQDILQFLRTYVEEHGISPTLEEIAAQFGVNKVTIFGHVAEMERKGVIRRRAKGVSRSLELVDDEEELGGGLSLPVLGKIAAGAPIETIEEPEQLNFADLVPEGKDVYALEVQGESMIEDAIANGDIVLIERRQSARDGETVVAVLPDGDATLKRFYREGKQFRLQPANSSMSPIIVDEVEIRGVVIGVVRKY